MDRIGLGWFGDLPYKNLNHRVHGRSDDVDSIEWSRQTHQIPIQIVPEASSMIDTQTELSMADQVYSSWRNDPDYADLLPVFVDELPSMQRTLLEFAKVCDFENVKREAHKLRGTAGGYGYQGLSQLAGQLEDTCKTSALDSTAILQDIDRLIEYIERVRV
jgi:HPt (histidine-containing phosphotransfer) domain-containing protein